MRIVFLPIDNRPVCYCLAQMIADIDDGIELVLPKRDLLGDLHKSANIDRLFEWLFSVEDADAYVLALDTLTYGGLIPSRRGNETFEQIQTRISKLKSFLKTQSAKVYAFSSIMRISNNNVNEEEKEYWNLYGKKIFQYSFNLDKFGTAETDVPEEILNDYLSTRNRNFEANKLYLECQKEGLFETLIFSKDDCAEYGLNVKEAGELELLGGYTKTGADEIPLTLLARAINSNLSVNPVFIEDECKDLISNYEDISIEKSVLSQLELSGISLKKPADVDLIVNNFKLNQGEIVMKTPTEQFSSHWVIPDNYYAIADVRNANGADNNFVKKLFEVGLGHYFLGYSAWNTSANTIGTLVCILKTIFHAKQNGTFNETALKKLQMVRFLDDWAYQANVRQQLTSADENILQEKMKPYEKELAKLLNIDFPYKCSYSFPWQRLFEVEIEFS